MLLTWLYYTCYAKFSLNDTVCVICKQPASYCKPKTVSHKYTNTLVNLYVWNQPCFQALTKLSVGTAIDGKLSKEGQEMRLRSTCVYTSSRPLHQQNNFTNADAYKL